MTGLLELAAQAEALGSKVDDGLIDTDAEYTERTEAKVLLLRCAIVMREAALAAAAFGPSQSARNEAVPDGWTATEYVYGEVYSSKHPRVAQTSNGFWVATHGGDEDYPTASAAMAAMDKAAG